MSFAAKVDANQAEIVAALRKAGAIVQPLQGVKEGCPDLLIGYRGKNFLIEVKSAKGRLNDLQRAWHALWLGQVDVATDTFTALAIIGAIKPEGKP